MLVPASNACHTGLSLSLSILIRKIEPFLAIPETQYWLPSCIAEAKAVTAPGIALLWIAVQVCCLVL